MSRNVSSLTANKKTTIIYIHLECEITSKMAALKKTDFAVFLIKMPVITYSIVASVGWIVTLLPLFAFLDFRFRFSHIVFEVIDENMTDTAHRGREYTPTGNGLFSHNASTKSARNLTANQQTGAAACKFSLLTQASTRR